MKAILALLSLGVATAKFYPSVDVTIDVNRWLDQQASFYKGAFDAVAPGFSGGRHKLDRDKMTKAVAEHFGSQNLNVVVIKEGNGLVNQAGIYKFPGGVSTACHCFGWCQTCYFDVYYAPKGIRWTFTNLGDGGYINWAFSGRGKRDGGRIEFW